MFYYYLAHLHSCSFLHFADSCVLIGKTFFLFLGACTDITQVAGSVSSTMLAFHANCNRIDGIRSMCVQVRVCVRVGVRTCACAWVSA